MSLTVFTESISTIFSFRSLIDIALVAILFYQIISMLRGTRAAQVLIGMLVIFVAFVFSNLLQFETLHWIISKFYSSFIMVVIVLFQDDIRRLLSRFGKGPFFSGMEFRSGGLIIQEVVSAAKSLSHERIGALVVFERSIGLDKLYDHSVQLNALVSEQLLMSIFQSFSPLHDGAVIVQKNRISCASAQLPLSKNPLFSKKMGTRHSAAVGISEETDAVVLVVSEESGHISIAWDGNLQKQTSADAARKMLHSLLLPRGDRNPYVVWWNETFLFKYNRFLVRVRSVLRLSSRKFLVERRRNLDRRHLMHVGTEGKEFSSYRVQAPVGQQVQFSQNIFVRFHPKSSVTELVTPVEYFVSTYAKHENSRQENGVHHAHGDEIKPHGVPHATPPFVDEEPSPSEVLRSAVELLPQDRFDPPIPKPPPPRDVVVGGVSLNPPLEEMGSKPSGDSSEENQETKEPLEQQNKVEKDHG